MNSQCFDEIIEAVISVPTLYKQLRAHKME